MIPQKRNNQLHTRVNRNNSSLTISTLIFSIYLPIFLIIIACIYTYHNYIRIRPSIKSDTSRNVVFTEEQLQYIPSSIKYQLKSSPPNMPSVLLAPEEEKIISKVRHIYGGKYDKPHLGGFTDYDSSGISLNVFNYMIGELAIKSFIDVGCGKGVSTKYFLDHGLKVLCVEGSHDAVTQSLLPQNRVVEHDFSRGPWWPADTYDAAWSVEFLEHVGRQYMDNYMPIFHKSALIFVTASGWGGWHHVEVHGPWWWKTRFAMEGFVYSPELTAKVVKHAYDGKAFPLPGKKRDQIDASHLVHSMYVYINLAVASLPRHRHLIGGPGCFDFTNPTYQKQGIPCSSVVQQLVRHNSLIHYSERCFDFGMESYKYVKECGGADRLPNSYQSLQNCKIQNQTQWVCEKNPHAIPQL